MTKKHFLVVIGVLVLLGVGVILAQRQITRISTQNLCNSIFSAPTMAERKKMYGNLTPAQKADIWKWDLLIKVQEYELTGTEKGQILTELSAAFFPDLFDVEKTAGSPSEGNFAERLDAKRFFELMGRFSNSFSAAESKAICAGLGMPTDPSVEKALRDKNLADDPDLPACVCNATSYCNSCESLCFTSSTCERNDDGCGCFWLWGCTGKCL